MTEPGIIRVVMPQMGESLAEGTIVRWLKTPGERIERDEALFELSTDKVDTEVPSPAAGILKSILIAEGQTVEVGAAVALIQTEEAAPSQSATMAPPSAVIEETGGHFKSSHAPQLVSFRRDLAAPAAIAPAGTPQSPSAAAPPRPIVPAAPAATPISRSFSPAVLEEVRRNRVPLDRLGSMRGTGRGGRITKRDVQRFLEELGHTAPSAGSATDRTVTSADTGPPAEYLYRPTPADRLEPMSTARKSIARHMRWSVRISPHATAQSEADMNAVSALMATREAFRQEIGVPLTYTVFAAAATVRALRDFPILNSSVVGDQIAFKPYVNLGVAVALAESDDLIVPVVRHAEDLSLVGLARAMHDLVTRARLRQLRPEDVQGGTFTLTNPGVFGGITGTPILNQPQVAILGLGAVRKQAVVIDDALAVRPMMALAVTFDHRAADGMVAFRFLARLRELLEAPPEDWDWTK
jgi:pyruvate dehydrogenase E2 component (dihydrolipoamide acetyltransferase)